MGWATDPDCHTNGKDYHAMDQITQIFTTLQSNLLTLVIPVGVVGFILWGLATLLTPIIPEWAQGLRGYFQRAMLTVAFLGFAVAFVTALYGLGAGAGG
jgi:hypothetical protein